MAASFKYWNDCVEPQDMEAMWMDPEVSTEWIEAGETRGQNVHLSRDPDGQPYLTQTEMKAVAGIIVHRHFASQMDVDMICAIAELESDRQPLATRYDKKTKETTVGIMQIFPKTANWLVRERSEEFVVRAYRGGTKKATHKSTLAYWRRYLSVKGSLPSRWLFMFHDDDLTYLSLHVGAGVAYTYWDSRASPEDMEEMWNHPDVVKEWTKSGEKRGKVRFSHDAVKRPYLSQVELKAVAEIVLSKHFSTKGVKPTILCAVAEIISMRFVNGVGSHTGIMGVDFPTAVWLYREVGYKAYKVESVDDLTNPFISMYFGAAYLAWLSEYEGRERTPQFIVQAYLGGPKNVNLQETGPVWLKFEEALSSYEGSKR
ncbi:hypothetical protein L1049_022951 [Liquidambar formosana]|uniref:Transglycosylase SLT domain-containing protein n=1 Tax=Liquidambar formosana TaxID=63359 RepID=A0AAP0RDT4_LIQFO